LHCLFATTHYWGHLPAPHNEPSACIALKFVIGSGKTKIAFPSNMASTRLQTSATPSACGGLLSVGRGKLSLSSMYTRVDGKLALFSFAAHARRPLS
jgi:hypothetical protein